MRFPKLQIFVVVNVSQKFTGPSMKTPCSWTSVYSNMAAGIWKLLWLFISTKQTSIYISTFLNALSSKKDQSHEISTYFSTKSTVALCPAKCPGFQTKHANCKRIWIYRLLCLMMIKIRHVKTIYWLRSLRPRLHGSGQIFARTNFVPGPPVYMDPCKFCCSGVYTDLCKV